MSVKKFTTTQHYTYNIILYINVCQANFIALLGLTASAIFSHFCGSKSLNANANLLGRRCQVAK